jgi:multisubunit Na+/H+ antiporter MnhG subunit
MNVAIDVLVAAAVAGELVCCAGLVVRRRALDRLHYAGAASTLPPLLLAAAVLLDEGWTAPGINALLIALLLLVLNAVVVHATARVANRSLEL